MTGVLVLNTKSDCIKHQCSHDGSERVLFGCYHAGRGAGLLWTSHLGYSIVSLHCWQLNVTIPILPSFTVIVSITSAICKYILPVPCSVNYRTGLASLFKPYCFQYDTVLFCYTFKYSLVAASLGQTGKKLSLFSIMKPVCRWNTFFHFSCGFIISKNFLFLNDLLSLLVANAFLYPSKST